MTTYLHKKQICRLLSLILIVSCQDSKFDDEFLPGNNNTTTIKTVSWDFSSSSDYSCESGSCSSGKNIVVSSGKASLQVVDTEHSGSDFSSGSHVGSQLSSSKLSTQTSSYAEHDVSWTPEYASLVAYFKLNGSWTNEIGTGDLTASGNPTFVNNGKLGKAATFDGSNDEVIATLTGSAILNFDSDFTLSYWIAPDVSHDASGVSFTRPLYIPCNTGYLFDNWIYDSASGSSGAARHYIYDGTNVGGIVPTAYTSNEFHHILHIKRGSTLELYIDGVAKTPNGISNITTTGATCSKIHLGRTNYKGLIDDVAVWNKAISSSDAATIYARQATAYADDTSLNSSWTPHYSSLVGYWKMDGNWQDSSGNGHNGTAYGNATFSTTSRVGSQSGVLDGVGDYVNGGSISINGPVSVTAWAKINSSSAGTVRRLFTIFNNQLSLYLQTGNYIVSNYNSGYCTSSEVPFTEQWGFYTLVYDGTNLKTYFDNKLICSAALSSGTVSNDFFIGSSLGSQYWSGNIDDIAVFSTALSTADIATIYNRQKQKYAASYKSPVIDMGSTQSLTTLATTTELPFAKELTTSSESSSDYSSLNGNLNSNLIGSWSLNESSWNGTANELVDSSGNSAHGAATNSISSTSSILGSGPSLGTAGRYFEVTHSKLSGLSDILTTCFWVKSTDVSGATSWTSLVQKADGATNGWWISRRNNGTKMHIRSDTNAQFNYSVQSTADVFDGDFHHVCVSFNNGSITSWIDGVSDVSGSYTVGTGYVNTSNLYIGGTTIHQGIIDEVSLWARVLSSTEVQELYRRGANRVKYQVRTCSDSTCSTDPEWKGPGGDGTTYFSELYNRVNTDLHTMFASCNSSGDNICSNTEFSLSGDTQATSLDLLFSDTNFGTLNSRYWQYRVLMEAEDNTACSDSVCLPTLSGITFSPSNFYYAGTPEIKSSTSIYVPKTPTGLEESKSGSCTITYQFSTDGTNYKYWNGSSWISVSSNSDANTASVISAQLSSLTTYPSSLYFKAFMTSDGYQSCELDQLSVKYTQ